MGIWALAAQKTPEAGEDTMRCSKRIRLPGQMLATFHGKSKAYPYEDDHGCSLSGV
jgi:hypothetical protein